MEQQTVTNSAVIHGLCAMTFQSAMHCSLRLTPTMINHLTSIKFADPQFGITKLPSYVAVPGRNQTLFCCVFRSHFCVRSAV